MFPLDDFVKVPLAVMEAPDGMFEGNKAPIWAAFRGAADLDMPSAGFDMMEHDAFIDRAKNAYAVVQTGETAFTAISSSARASFACKAKHLKTNQSQIEQPGIVIDSPAVFCYNEMVRVNFEGIRRNVRSLV